MKLKVKVQTFKDSGKFYDEWEHEVITDNPIAWYEVIEDIRELKEKGKLPQSNMTYVVSESLCGNYGFPQMIK